MFCLRVVADDGLCRVSSRSVSEWGQWDGRWTSGVACEFMLHCLHYLRPKIKDGFWRATSAGGVLHVSLFFLVSLV